MITTKRHPIAQALPLALLITTGANAAVFTVTNAGDAGPGTLRDAIALANATPAPDSIVFAAGIGTVTITSGELALDAPITIDGSTTATSVAITRTAGAGRIFRFAPGAAPSSIDSLVISGGTTSATGSLDCSAGGNGGGICTRAALTISRSTITGNSTSGVVARGGGLFGFAAPITLNQSSISGNSTSGVNAGGAGMGALNSPLRMADSIISNNTASGSSSRGGGLATVSSQPVQISNSIISNNTVSGTNARAGGAYIAYSGVVDVANSTISGNSVTNGGVGGGLYFYYSNDIDVRSSTISGNTVGGPFQEGSAIAVRYYGDAVIANSTITGNSATPALQITLYSSIALESTIVSGNVLAGGGGSPGDVAADSFTANNSLIGTLDPPTQIPVGSNIIDPNPQLAALADNGCATPAGPPGATQCAATHALLPGSPAIDAGAAAGETSDQRGTGFPRVAGAAADIGAVEAQTSPPVVSGGSAQPIPSLPPLLMGLLALLVARLGVRRHF